MKKVPSREEFFKNPEYWKTQMRKPSSTTEILLIVLLCICAPLTYFIVPQVVKQYAILYKILAVLMLVFAIYLLISIIFRKQLAKRSLKKRSGADQIIEDSKGEFIEVIEE